MSTIRRTWYRFKTGWEMKKNWWVAAKSMTHRLSLDHKLTITRMIQRPGIITTTTSPIREQQVPRTWVRFTLTPLHTNQLAITRRPRSTKQLRTNMDHHSRPYLALETTRMEVGQPLRHPASNAMIKLQMVFNKRSTAKRISTRTIPTLWNIQIWWRILVRHTPQVVLLP